MLVLLKRLIELAGKTVALAGGFLILFIGCILFCEVVLRSASHPTDWINEWSVYLFTWAVLFGGTWTLREGRHVRVELLMMHLSEKAKLALDVLTSLMGAALCGLVAWQGWVHFVDALETGETSATSLRVPLWLTDFALPLGFILLTLQFLLLAGERYVSIVLLRRFGHASGTLQQQDGANE